MWCLASLCGGSWSTGVPLKSPQQEDHGPSSGGPSKRERLEPVSVVIPSVTKSHPTFLCIKEGVSSLRGKDFNLKALIQASMLGQFDRDMVREVGPHALMDSITHFATSSWGIVEF